MVFQHYTTLSTAEAFSVVFFKMSERFWNEAYAPNFLIASNYFGSFCTVSMVTAGYLVHKTVWNNFMYFFPFWNVDDCYTCQGNY